MKNLFLAAVAALTLGMGVANAAILGDHSTIAGDRAATTMQQSEAVGGGG